MTDRPRAGRPTREQARRRTEALLDAALALFLDRGFELVTLDAIAAAVAMSKRTIRARYPDKKALFAAALRRAIDRWAVPETALWAETSDDLETTLLAIARLRVGRAIDPEGRRLLRLLDVESYRFPDIARHAHVSATVPTIAFVADLLRRHAERGTIRVDRPELAAAAFVALAIDAPARATGLGDARIDEDIRYCVGLFLDGVRQR